MDKASFIKQSYVPGVTLSHAQRMAVQREFARRQQQVLGTRVPTVRNLERVPGYIPDSYNVSKAPESIGFRYFEPPLVLVGKGKTDPELSKTLSSSLKEYMPIAAPGHSRRVDAHIKTKSFDEVNAHEHGHTLDNGKAELPLLNYKRRFTKYTPKHAVPMRVTLISEARANKNALRTIKTALPADTALHDAWRAHSLQQYNLGYRTPLLNRHSRSIMESVTGTPFSSEAFTQLPFSQKKKIVQRAYLDSPELHPNYMQTQLDHVKTGFVKQAMHHGYSEEQALNLFYKHAAGPSGEDLNKLLGSYNPQSKMDQQKAQVVHNYWTDGASADALRKNPEFNRALRDYKSNQTLQAEKPILRAIPVHPYTAPSAVTPAPAVAVAEKSIPQAIPVKPQTAPNVAITHATPRSTATPATLPVPAGSVDVRVGKAGLGKNEWTTYGSRVSEADAKLYAANTPTFNKILQQADQPLEKLLEQPARLSTTPIRDLDRDRQTPLMTSNRHLINEAYPDGNKELQAARAYRKQRGDAGWVTSLDDQSVDRPVRIEPVQNITTMSGYNSGLALGGGNTLVRVPYQGSKEPFNDAANTVQHEGDHVMKLQGSPQPANLFPDAQTGTARRYQGQFSEIGARGTAAQRSAGYRPKSPEDADNFFAGQGLTPQGWDASKNKHYDAEMVKFYNSLPPEEKQRYYQSMRQMSPGLVQQRQNTGAGYA